MDFTPFQNLEEKVQVDLLNELVIELGYIRSEKPKKPQNKLVL